MSKIVAGTAFVLLGGATVAGGVLLSKPKTDAELPKENLQEKIHEEGCLTSLFGQLEKVEFSGSSSTDATQPVDVNYFTDSGSRKKTEGCLVVNWDKYNSTKENETTKWKGTFRFLWAVKGENEKGFVVFLLGDASNSGNKKEIKWDGGAFTLALEGTNESKKWTVKKKHGIPATTSETKSFQKSSDGGSTDNSKFPIPGEALGLETGQTFWGFFGQESDLDNICGANECTDENARTHSKFRGYWEWKSSEDSTNQSGAKKLSDWTKNLDKWWPETFGDSFKVKEVAENHQGTWTNRVREPKTNPSTPS